MDSEQIAAQSPVTLPDKLSDLLIMAVLDARKIQQKYKKDYVLEMNEWHAPWEGQASAKCHVCMAGSVMVCRLGAEHDKLYWPEDFGDENQGKLNAINAMRTGNFTGANFQITGRDESDENEKLFMDLADLVWIRMMDWIDRAPWSVYIHAARKLREAGL